MFGAAFVQCGVGGNHGVKAVQFEQIGNCVYLGFIQIGCDFESHWDVASVCVGQFHLARFERAQQLVECVFLLQIAQIFGVRRGDIDGDVAGVRVDAAQRREVVVGGVFDRRGGIFANIDAENTAVLDKLAARDVGEQGVYALVVKSHAVDDRLLFGNAKEPRFGVALLRTRGDGADFDKAKAHGGEYIDVLAIFVQSGSQTDAVGEGQAHQ